MNSKALRALLIVITQCYLASTSINMHDGRSLRKNVELIVQQQRDLFHHLRGRNRRESNSNHHLYRDEKELWILKGFHHYRGCPGVLSKFHIFHLDGSLFAATISNAADNNTHIHRFSLESGCQELQATLPTKTALDLALIKVNDALRLVVVEKYSTWPLKHPGSQVYKIQLDPNGKLSVEKAEVLWSEHSTCITTWVQFGVPHLVICNSMIQDGNIQTYLGKSNIYCASGGYFDRCGEIETFNPQKIVHFSLFSRHFLAVANYPNETAAENVPSEIFQYDLAKSTYLHFQYLPTKGATDICFVTLGSNLHKEHFLVVVNHHTFDRNGQIDYDVSSYIYKFVEKFEPFQTIPTHKGTSCLAYQTNQDHLVLLFSDASGATAYQYDGWRFVPASAYTQHAMGPGLIDLNTASINDQLFITASNNNPTREESSNVFLPVFDSHPTLSQFYGDSLKWCLDAKNKLESDPVGLIANIYPHAVKKNDTNIKLGRVEFGDVSANKVLVDELISEPERVRIGQPAVRQLQTLHKRITNLVDKLLNLSDKENRAMRITGHYVFKGPVTANLISSSCTHECVITNVNATKVNDANMDEIYDQMIHLDDETVPAKLYFDRLVLNGSLATPILNDRNLTDYIRTDRDVIFSAPVQIFGNVNFDGGLAIDGYANDRKITKSTLLLKKGDQDLNWDLQVESVQLPTLNVNSINGHQVDNYFRNALNTESNFTLIRPKFKGMMSVSNVTVTGLINGIDLHDLYNSSMKVTGDQTVTGSHIYDVVKANSFTVKGDVNGQIFPDERFIFISDTESPASISTLRLLSDATFVQLNVSNDFGHLKVTNGTLGSNLLKANSDSQIITGKKNFATVITKGNVSAELLNGQPVPQFRVESSVDNSTPLSYEQLDVKGHVKFAEPLLVGELADIDLNRVKQKGVPLNVSEFPPFNSVEFSSVSLDGDLTSPMVDGIPAHHFVLKNSTGPITFQGNKIFKNNVTMQNSTTLHSDLNGYNLTRIWQDSLQNEGNQTLHDLLIIEGDVITKTISAEKIPFFPLNNVSRVHGTKIFTTLKIQGDSRADFVEIEGLLDGINISSWQEDTLFRDESGRDITGRKTFANLTANAINITDLNDFNFSEFDNVVMTNKLNRIDGILKVQGPFYSNQTTVEGQIDGEENNLPLFWLRNEVDQNLQGVSSTVPLTVNKLYDSSWMINNISIDRILNDTIRIGQPINLPSLKFNHVKVNNINIGGKIQDSLVPQDFIIKDSEALQSIEGHKIFISSVSSDTLHVENLINGQDPQHFCQSEPIPQSSKWIVQGNVIVEKNSLMNVTSINSLKLEDLLEQVWLEDDDIKLMDVQIFEDLTVEDLIVSEAIIDGINLQDLEKRAVYLSADKQQVTGVHKLNDVKASSLILGNYEGQLLNDISITNIEESVMLRNTEQKINETRLSNITARNVTLSGKVNGVDLSEDLMRHDKPNVVTGPKTFRQLAVEKNVDMCENCTIDGIDVSKWNKSAVLRRGNFTVASPVHFQEVTFEEPLQLGGKLDGFLMDRGHLMTLSDPQIITGKLTFSAQPPNDVFNDLYLREAYQNSTERFRLAARIGNMSVMGTYNGVDLSHFFEKSVHKNLNVTLTEPASLAALETSSLDDSSVNSTLRDILLNGAGDEYHFADMVVVQPVQQSEMDALMDKLSAVVSKQPRQFQYFQEIEREKHTFTDADLIYPISVNDGDPSVCYYSQRELGFYCNLSNEPLLQPVTVISVASNEKHIAVTVTNQDGTIEAIIYSYEPSNIVELQRIPMSNSTSTVSVNAVDGSCFLFASNIGVETYCKSTSDSQFSAHENLASNHIQQLSVCYQEDGTPVVAARNTTQGTSLVMVWTMAALGQFQAWKTLSMTKIIAMDCACDNIQCFVATLSPSKPAAIPGEVIIWSLDGSEQPTRLQRITVSEPNDVKFAQLPGGRLSVNILQRSGIHNVLVYIWLGQSSFTYKGTVHIPGVVDFHLISSESHRLFMMVTVKKPPSDDKLGHSVRLFEAAYLGLPRYP